MAKNQKSFGAAAGFFEDAPKAKPERVPQEDSTAATETPSMTLKNTQGRKGQKLPRINMGFTPENHEYITRVSRQNGQSITEYVNRLIEKDRGI